MKTTLTSIFKLLESVLLYYNGVSNAQKFICLQEFQKSSIPTNHLLEKYNNILIFICAHPPNPYLLKLAESEHKRISDFLKKLSYQRKSKWINSGLPYTEVVSNFSIDLVRWMVDHEIPVTLDSFDEQGEQFKNILKFTLPDLEKEVTAIEDENEALLNTLKVKKKNILGFLLAEFERLKDQPLIKDYFFDELKLTFRIQLKKTEWCKSFNRIKTDQVFYHDELIKKFDHIVLLNTSIQEAIHLDTKKKTELIRICKIKLILLQRETEPVSYMDEKSLHYYELERGISIAFFTMIPERQLPLESYVGYTLFRNGFPAAYGGAWILGKRALFGINIFDWFRGGESGYILCQLLRTYRQVFSIDYFEVEPYQYGLGNPEGIESGAFWFYYKYGFRPLDKTLEKIAHDEQQKISINKVYKTNSKTLERFTESNIALNLGGNVPIAMWQIRDRISSMIHKKYNDNRFEAEQKCITNFTQKSFFKKELDKHQIKVFTDIALVSEAFQWNSENIYRILEQMVLEKPKDVYKYQQNVLKLFRHLDEL